MRDIFWRTCHILCSILDKEPITHQLNAIQEIYMACRINASWLNMAKVKIQLIEPFLIFFLKGHDI